MKLVKYRYFLNPTSQLTLFQSNIEKKEILKRVLHDTIQFPNRTSTLGYSLIRQENDFVYARLGKRSKITKSLPPETNFEEKIEEHWPACDMFISLLEDPINGQTIAVEHNSAVFQNELNPLRALSDVFNLSLQSEGLEMSINPITDERNFWELVRENQNQIREVVFCYRAPNLFKLENSLNEELTDAKETFMMTEAEVSLKNDQGHLQVPENDFMKQSVDYIARGGGEYKLIANGKVYTSNKNHKTKEVVFDIDIETSDKESFLSVISRIFND